MGLPKILDAHNKWIKNKNEGTRADLSTADLREANLSAADLRWADLSEANLSRANLSGANLRWANLRGANLSAAKGIIYVGFDNRGYTLICWLYEGEKWFNAGCRSFSEDAALTHWSSAQYETPKRGQLYITSIKWLSMMADEVLK